MALLVRGFIIEEINGWDETALHDHLRAHPSLRHDLGFETLPNYSPRVDANQFLTVAKQYYGLDPPD
uniref:hypothetical protein n=1 Tax=Halocatena marina TaxID=2934937 RepID=UPI0035A0C321